jgi:TonB family protein
LVPKLSLMSTTHTPPRDPSPSPKPVLRSSGTELYDPSHWEEAYRNTEVFDAPKLLIQLENELSRSRRREAFWISVVVHVVLGVVLWNTDYIVRFFPHRHTLLESPNDWMKQRDTTFIELPPDAQKLTKRPETNVISDKDRVATHNAPLDPNELKKIIEASRRGAQAQQQAPQAPQPAQTAQNNPGPQPPSAPREEHPLQPRQEIAQIKPPPEGPKVLFGGSVSAGAALDQAARAAAANRGGYSGDSGDNGLTQGRQGGAASNLDILSDTMGVDFGPYLTRVLHDVRVNWYNLIPEVARPPLSKQGKVSIEFAILKDGRVSAMRLAGTSGDVSLDRAAWGGINGCNPFPPLPSDFKGEYLFLRFNFYYNPDGSSGIR